MTVSSSSPLLPSNEANDDPDHDSATKEHRHWFLRLTSRRNILPFFTTLLGTLVIVLAITLLTSMDPPQKQNLVLMVSDGMGPGSLSLARSFMQYTEDVEFHRQLPLDPYMIGTSRTRSQGYPMAILILDSLITDSAAGATAFACGIKTYNRAIGVDPRRRPCGTVLEAAKRQGYKTGIVVTSKITDATPACFASHVLDRDYENIIAEQLIGGGPLNRTVDLMFGGIYNYNVDVGGRCHFLPKGNPASCRSDSKDLLAMADQEGITYIPDRTTFDALNHGKDVNLPVLGLFSSHHMSYTIDRIPQDQPSLAEMAQAALEALHSASSSSDQGFFLLIEGSRIDMAAHSNDPVGHVHDVLAFNDAFHVTRKFIDRVGGVLISTSDHETGGLSVGRQMTPTYPEYIWFPEVIANASHSTEYLGYQIVSYSGTLLIFNKGHNEREFIEKDIVQDGLGIHDATTKEIDMLVQSKANALLADYTLADMISRRAQIGWATHGHSATDVNIYAAGDPAVDKLRGNHENTEIGLFIKEYLELDLDAVKKVLNSE